MCITAGLESNPIATMSVEEFHGITLAPSAWGKRTSYQAFYVEVNKRLACNTLGEWAQKALQRLVWREAYNAMFLSMKPHYRRTARRVADEAYYKCTDAIGQARRKVGSRYFAKLLNEDITQLAALADTFLGRVHDFIITKKETLREQQDTREDQEQEDQTPPLKKRKVCSFWTTAEDEILIQGVKDRKKWRHIAKELPNRSNVNCKDRDRTLRKQGKMI